MPAATHATTYADAYTQTDVECVAPAPVAEYIAPAPAVHTTSVPDVHAAPATVIKTAAFVPVTEFVTRPAAADFVEPPMRVVQIVQVPQVQTIDEIVGIPELLTVQGTQTSVSLGAAPARHVDFAEMVKVVEFEPLLPAGSAPPLRVTTPVVDVPPVVVELIHTVPVVGFVAPAALAPVVETCEAPTPVVDRNAAPVVEYIAPAPQ